MTTDTVQVGITTPTLLEYLNALDNSGVAYQFVRIPGHKDDLNITLRILSSGSTEVTVTLKPDGAWEAHASLVVDS